MKKISIRFLLMLVIVGTKFTGTAQIKLSNEGKIPKTIFVIPTKEIVRSTPENIKGIEDLKISTWLTITPGKGQTLNFQSNKIIEKITVVYNYPKNISTSILNKSTGLFFLESPAYSVKPAENYMFKFYVKGNENVAWICMLAPKK